MKRKSFVSFILFIVFAIFLLPQTLFSKELTDIKKLQPPPWPLIPFNKLEREARLKFVLDTQQYHVVDVREPMTKRGCQKLLKKLKDSNAVKILSPDIIAQSRDDIKVPDNIIEHCSTVEFDRVWFTYNKGVLSAGVDSVFDALPLDQKDAYADFYHKKTGLIEFYNFSRFFKGKKVWGTFTEAGEFICNNDRKLCSELEGYHLCSDVVIGSVVDVESCTQYLLSKVKAGGRLSVGNVNPYAFRELPNFYAYAEIDKFLYRLGLSTPISWGQFHRLLYEGGTTFIVEPVNYKNGGVCVYETKSQIKGN